MAVKRCGSVVARSPLRSTRKPRKSHRPFLKTWTTSIAMQAASANASACTGDGPACEALSSVICTSPDRPPNTRSCSQTSETLVGGFTAIVRFYRGPQINTVLEPQMDTEEQPQMNTDEHRSFCVICVFLWPDAVFSCGATCCWDALRAGP